VQSGAPETAGAFDRFSLELRYPVVAARATSFELTGAVESVEQRQTAVDFDVDLSHDRYWAIRSGASYSAEIAESSALSTTLALSAGLAGRDESDAIDDDVPLSRAGARSTFRKLEVEVDFDMAVVRNLRARVRARAQHSFNEPMLAAEQLPLDGVQGLSGFPNGTFNVDSGMWLRTEIAYPVTAGGEFSKVNVSPYGFAAFGLGSLVAPTALEEGNVKGGCIGIGLRTGSVPLSAFGVNAHGTVEISDGWSNIDSEDASGWRVGVGLSLTR
jgi:hemolysin activation/secretion protein